MTRQGQFSLESYVVRVYRRARGQTRRVVCVVEQVGAPGRHSFGDVDGLWEIWISDPRVTSNPTNLIPIPPYPNVPWRVATLGQKKFGRYLDDEPDGVVKFLSCAQFVALQRQGLNPQNNPQWGGGRGTQPTPPPPPAEQGWLVWTNRTVRPALLGVAVPSYSGPGWERLARPYTARDAWAYVCNLHGRGVYWSPDIAEGRVNCRDLGVFADARGGPFDGLWDTIQVHTEGAWRGQRTEVILKATTANGITRMAWGEYTLEGHIQGNVYRFTIYRNGRHHGEGQFSFQGDRAFAGTWRDDYQKAGTWQGRLR